MESCPCCERAWTKQEDDRLFNHIQAHGEAHWKSVPKTTGLLRCGKNCKLRWMNYLLPDLKPWNISEDEEQLIIKLHALLGNRWSLIAGRLPGRTGNEIRNFWNTHISRKLVSQGIDPISHRPIHCVDNESSSSSNSEPLNHEIQTVDFFKHGGVRMSGDFEGGASNADSKNEEPPDVNLDLSMSLPCYSRETVDLEDLSK
ncbi:hypothetical protein SUGI_0470280 [Cryptomeria japonica]|uniref:transcription repressor MYB4 n=1 Tax=Cryptomeria japonica TaxID=3369 RepID=UPI002408D6E2|nr:transcription repressor MYB4 [Cryptomeria japonica]GLJ24599.1 hypothetical protein SUGI_0470280 [Cryptomeria japonica]